MSGYSYLTLEQRREIKRMYAEGERVDTACALAVIHASTQGEMMIIHNAKCSLKLKKKTLLADYSTGNVSFHALERFWCCPYADAPFASCFLFGSSLRREQTAQDLCELRAGEDAAHIEPPV